MRLLLASQALLLSLALLYGAQAAAVTPDELRAIWYYKFAKNTHWPNQPGLHEFTLGFYPEQPQLEAILKGLTRDKLLHGKAIRIVHYQSLKEATQAQLLVLDPGENTRLEAVFAALRGTQTLLITEAAEASLHTMVNLKRPNEKRFTFEVHRPNIIREQLNIAKVLLLSGGREVDIDRIYKELETAIASGMRSLDSQQQKIAEQQRQLKRQNRHLEDRNQQINNRQEKLGLLSGRLDSATEKLKRDNRQLEQLSRRIDIDRAALVDNQKNLLQQGLTLQDKKQTLAEKTREIKLKAQSIEDNNRTIEQQAKLITEQEKDIQQQTNSLKEKTQTIDTQSQLLRYQQLTSIIFSLLLALSLYAVWSRIRSTKSLQKSNLELEGSNRLLEKANITLADTTDELRRTSESKSLFLSTMSHEIRTPMNGVLGMADLLETSQLTKEQEKYLGVIKSSGRLLVSVINDILDYSKIEAGKMEVEHIEFNLDTLLHDCISGFAMKAEEVSIDLRLLVEPSIPDSLAGDPTRITQILTNFLSNAFKFTERGKIQVRARLIRERCVWRLSVKDSGCGMSPDEVTRIFHAFTQADASITRSHGGTGLGLSICKRLTELMGGEVGVVSQVGQGSTFWAEFPIDEANLSRPRKQLPKALARLTVLVAMEHAELRANLCGYIRRWGISAIDIASAEQLLKAIEQFPSCADGGGKPDDKDTGDSKPIVLLSEHLLPAHSPKMNVIQNNSNLIYVHANMQANGDWPCAEPPVATLHQPINASMIFDTLMELHQPQTLAASSARITSQYYPAAQVLVAEDNLVNQMVIKGLLKQHQIDAQVVDNGQLALEAIQAGEFDLVFMDCEMPVLDGYAATEQIRAAEKADQHIPIVALTAHAMTEHHDKARSVGMDEHLAKPINRSALEAILKRYCSEATQ